ncbi:hypothetical protein AUP68_07359 [Ilyonectria robusta]
MTNSYPGNGSYSNDLYYVCSWLTEYPTHPNSLLRSAAENGDGDTVRLALSMGANIETLDQNGRTPLYQAVKSWNEAAIQLLLENGANLQTNLWDGRTPLLCAERTGNMDKLFALVHRPSMERFLDARLAMLDTIAQSRRSRTYDTRSGWNGYLRCDWEVPAVLTGILGPHSASKAMLSKDEVYHALGGFVVITGVTNSFACSTCMEFLQKTWDGVGLDALSIIARGAHATIQQSLGTRQDLELPSRQSHHDTSQEACIPVQILRTLPENIILSLQVANTHSLQVGDYDTHSLQAAGYDTHSLQVADYDTHSFIEAITWLCSALRWNPETTSRSREPRRTSEGLHKSVITQNVSVTGQHPGALCYSLSPLSKLSKQEIGPDGCWTSLFQSGVVAWHRWSAPWGGLELSFDRMVELAAVENYLQLSDSAGTKDGMILTGFYTALIPMRLDRKRNCVHWHFEQTQEIVDPLELTAIQSNHWARIANPATLSTSRCILGWHERAHVLLGTRRLVASHIHTLTWSGLPERKKSVHPTGRHVGAQFSTVMTPIKLTTQVTHEYQYAINVARFKAATQYNQAIFEARKKVGLVIDTDTQQAWLVPLLSLLLHACHKYFHYYGVEGSKEPYNIPFADESEDGASSAFKALENSGDIAVIGALNGKNAWTLGQLLLEMNANFMRSVKYLEQSKSLVTGLELMDMIKKPGQGSALREVDPRPSSWIYLAERADVVCTCSKLGLAIEAIPAIPAIPVIPAAISTSGPTCSCCVLPTGSYYLAAHMHCLSLLLEKSGKTLQDLRNGKSRFGAPGIQTIQTSPDTNCSHTPQDPDTSDVRHVIQKTSQSSSSKKEKERQTSLLREIPLYTGVVVLGTFQPAFAGPPPSRFQTFFKQNRF